MGSRTIIIGDIHGCLDEFRQLVAKLNLRPADRVICLADFMDKGPKPAACVRYAREMGFESVLGNHEEKHLRWRKHEDRRKTNPAYENPMRPLDPEMVAQNHLLTEEDIAWLSKLPTYIEFTPGWVAVHGGLLPGLALSQQDKADLIRLRWVDKEKVKPVATSYDTPWQVPEGAVHWASLYDGANNVVVGHEAHSLSKPVLIKGKGQGVTYCIDTGCVHGGKLTALVLEDGQVSFVQVQAKAVYAKHLTHWWGRLLMKARAVYLRVWA